MVIQYQIRKKDVITSGPTFCFRFPYPLSIISLSHPCLSFVFFFLKKISSPKSANRMIAAFSLLIQKRTIFFGIFLCRKDEKMGVLLAAISLTVVCLISRPASSSGTGTLPSHFYSRWRRQQHQDEDSESDSIESIYKTLSAPHVSSQNRLFISIILRK